MAFIGTAHVAAAPLSVLLFGCYGVAKCMQRNELVVWLDDHRARCDMQVEEIPWQASQEWALQQGHLCHRSGGFFSIVGVSLEGGSSRHPPQPLIYQPEIGILGFLLQRQAGRKHVLVQAKPEPGNVGLVQASPSVQATQSNYTRKHQGKETPFLDCFIGTPDVQVHASTLQSEQGTRFLGKYNRNLLVELPPSLVVDEVEGYRWAPLEELCALLAMDFQINTDARSVLVCSPWRLLAATGEPFQRWRGKGGLGEQLLCSYSAPERAFASSDEHVAGRLERMRETFAFTTQMTSLGFAPEWMAGRAAVLSGAYGSFEVRHYQVSSSAREVDFWDQPLIASTEEGLAVLLAKEINGVLHFLFKCRAEIGFTECFQYGPSIQSSGGVPAIIAGLDQEDEALMAALQQAEPLLSSRHSDEGGRFYKCVSCYRVMLLDSAQETPVTDALSWMTLAQVERFSQQQGFFSNEARSLVSMLLAYL